MGFSGQPKPDQANVLIQAQQQIALQVSPLSKTCMVNPFLYFWFVSTEGNLCIASQLTGTFVHK
jgi:hypothetical protein